MRWWKKQGNGTAHAARNAIYIGILMFVLSGVFHKPMSVAAAEENATVVKIDNFSFTPMEVTITAGSTVMWINKDDVPHTVVSTDHKFKSQALDTDEAFSFTFPAAGRYEYFCSVHPKMVGKIIVK